LEKYAVPSVSDPHFVSCALASADGALAARQNAAATSVAATMQ
jgi:hypothetical protein